MTTNAQQEAIRAVLAYIAKRDNGVLTPEAVLVDAQNKDSILHDLFDWNNKTAAHAWRLEQARTLIRSVRVVITTERTNVSTVAYIRDPDAKSDEQGYVTTASLVGDVERSRAVVVAEFSRAAAALRRARELAQVFDVAEEVDISLEAVEKIQTKVTAFVYVGSRADKDSMKKVISR